MNALIVAEKGRLASSVSLALRLRWPDLKRASADTASEGRRILSKNHPDVLFVSAQLPDAGALTLVEEIRHDSDVVVFVIGTSHEKSDIVEALEAGADDYLSTPISESLLVARVCAALRRTNKSGAEQESALQCGELAIEPEYHEARLKGKPLYLTPTEFTLLYHLARGQGRLVTQRALEGAIWGQADNLYIDVLRKHVQRLRRKLESPRGSHVTIATVPRIGYKLMQNKAARSQR
jgi:two-component system KDP operon response regulator KdpE